MESLKFLDMENNFISEIDVQDMKGILRNLSRINFKGNVLNCTHLKTVFTRFVEKRVKAEVGQEYFTENVKGIPRKETNNKIIEKNDEPAVEKIDQEENNKKDAHTPDENAASENKKKVIKKEDVGAALEGNALKMMRYDNKNSNNKFAKTDGLILERIQACFVFAAMIFVVLLGLIAVVMFYTLYVKFHFNSRVFKAGLVEANEL